MAEPIKIIITQGGDSGIGPDGVSGVGREPTSVVRGGKTGLIPGSESGFSLLEKIDALDDQLIHSLQGQIKSTIMYGISNYGNMTGNYITTRNIRNAIDIGTRMTGIAVATAKYGMAGFYITALSNIMDVGMQSHSFTIEVQKQNITAEFNRERAGNSLNSGSRGTYE